MGQKKPQVGEGDLAPNAKIVAVKKCGARAWMHSLPNWARAGVGARAKASAWEVWTFTVTLLQSVCNSVILTAENRAQDPHCVARNDSVSSRVSPPPHLCVAVSVFMRASAL